MSDMRNVFEHWFAERRAICKDDYTKGFALDAFEAAWDHQQAEIDRLMMEFCPDEMTAAQVASWEEHQRAVTGVKID